MPGGSSDVGPGPALTLAGRYELGELIGRGGMADVRRGFDHQLHRDVAVKILHAHLAAQPDARRRFRFEASSAARLNHPAAITVFDTGEGDEGPFIVMECLPGRTFADEMAEGPVVEARAREVGIEVLGALEAAHQLGIVHRDVKPSNIMLTKDGRPKIGDFGIARSVEGSDLTVTGQLLGTPRYVAPERLLGGGSSPAGDVYGLGVVLYEAVSGRPAFAGRTPVEVALAVTTSGPEPLAELCPDLDPRFRRAVERAMAPDPADRFPTAAAMAAALSADPPTAVMPDVGVAEPDAPTVALPRQELPPRPDVPVSGRPRRREVGRLLLAVVAALAVVLIVGALLLVAPHGEPDRPATPAGSSTTTVGAPAPPLPDALEAALREFERLAR